uniref:Uncharacterized protein n=1 Tax=Glossina palpalis gambiensis TaxID=67801 RepID=A0A1B0B1G5_9MUSC
MLMSVEGKISMHVLHIGLFVCVSVAAVLVVSSYSCALSTLRLTAVLMLPNDDGIHDQHSSVPFLWMMVNLR